ERIERRVDLGPAARCGDPVRDACGTKVGEQLRGAGKRAAVREESAEVGAVPLLDRLLLLRRQRPADLTRDRAGEEAAAHADPPVDPPAVDRHPDLVERQLPGKDVRVDGVDERAVEVEDERGHAGDYRRTAPPSEAMREFIGRCRRPATSFGSVTKGSTFYRRLGMRTKSLFAAVLCTAAIAGSSACAAFAGEITGNGKPTGGPAHANSICVFSGHNDDPGAPLDGSGPNGPGGQPHSCEPDGKH